MARRKKHDTKFITIWNGDRFLVDLDIARLVQIMNVPGLTTSNSCQGDYTEKAYVQFSGPLAPGFMRAVLDNLLVSKFSGPTDLEFGRWKDNATWPDSYDFRWYPSYTKKVSSLIKSAIEKVMNETVKSYW